MTLPAYDFPVCKLLQDALGQTGPSVTETSSSYRTVNLAGRSENPMSFLKIPYLDAVPLGEAILCESCRNITRVCGEECPMCGSKALTNLARLIAPIDARKV